VFKGLSSAKPSYTQSPKPISFASAAVLSKKLMHTYPLGLSLFAHGQGTQNSPKLDSYTIPNPEVVGPAVVPWSATWQPA